MALGGIIGGAIGALGGILGGGGPDEITQKSEPWSGVRPYLTTPGSVLPWTGAQAINLDWMRYLQELGEAQPESWMRTPPPMLMMDPRLTGQNVYQPEDAGGILGVDEWGTGRTDDVPVPNIDTTAPPVVEPPVIYQPRKQLVSLADFLQSGADWGLLGL